MYLGPAATCTHHHTLSCCLGQGWPPRRVSRLSRRTKPLLRSRCCWLPLAWGRTEVRCSCSFRYAHSCTFTQAYPSYQYVVSGNAGKGGKGAGAKGKPAEGADKAAKGGAAAGKKAGKDKPPVVSKPPPSVLAVSLILYRSHLLSGWGAHCALSWLYRETWPVLFLAALSDRSASTSRRPSTTPMAILTWGMPTR